MHLVQEPAPRVTSLRDLAAAYRDAERRWREACERYDLVADTLSYKEAVAREARINALCERHRAVEAELIEAVLSLHNRPGPDERRGQIWPACSVELGAVTYVVAPDPHDPECGGPVLIMLHAGDRYAAPDAD